MRRALVTGFVALALGSAAGGGCADGGGARAVRDLDGVATGERVRVEGELSLRGSTPFTLLVLETESGAQVLIDSRSPEMQSELKGLAGMRVAVEGSVRPAAGPPMPRLDATGYDMLKLPGGETPIVGLLSIEDGECFLAAADGGRYWILGDLAPAIREYGGARVWIVGKRSSAPSAARPPRCTPFTPTGYGVITEVPATR